MLRIYFFLLLALCSSCTRHLLEPSPTTTLSDATAFTTADKFQAAVNGLYTQVLNASFYGGRFIIFNEQRGDEFAQNDGNNSTGANVWNQTITSSGDFVNAVWTAAYAAINSSNIVIANAGAASVLSDSLKNNYTAEAKFIRAFCYFSLVQMYAKPYAQAPTAAGLPLRLKAETTGGDNNLAFSSVADVYTQIGKDLDDAETGLPVSYSTALLNVSRANKSTAIALKTRVYLAQANYDKVISEATKIVSASAPYSYTAGTVTHKLETGFATVFNGTYTGPEAVFTLPIVSAIEAPGNQSALAYNYLYPILPLNPAAISSNPALAAGSSDARAALIKTNTTGQRLLNKFSKNTVPYNDYIPAIRYAEVLLNYAEAAAGKNDLTTATALLNAVRHRSDPSYTFSTGDISTQSALTTTILTERRIELLGEGFRTMDLQRRVQTLPGKTGNAGTAPAVTPTASNYVWGIPSSEISYNTLAPH